VKQCPTCRARFKGEPTTCPLDGSKLIEQPDPMMGRTFAGRYVIESKLGSGGMGTVYRGRHEVVGRDVAIKFLAPELAIDPTNRQRFLREARAANKINHENIIDINDFGETDDGLVYLVMEYCPGEPLAAAMSKGPIPIPRALQIIEQLAMALGEGTEERAADLLLAVEDELHVDGGRHAQRVHQLDRVEVGPDGPLVVGGAARVEEEPQELIVGDARERDLRCAVLREP